MAMSKKHYVAVAKALKKAAVTANAIAKVDAMAGGNAKAMVATLIDDLANIFAADNAQFKYGTFYEAAGKTEVQ